MERVCFFLSSSDILILIVDYSIMLYRYQKSYRQYSFQYDDVCLDILHENAHTVLKMQVNFILRANNRYETIRWISSCDYYKYNIKIRNKKIDITFLKRGDGLFTVLTNPTINSLSRPLHSIHIRNPVMVITLFYSIFSRSLDIMCYGPIFINASISSDCNTRYKL